MPHKSRARSYDEMSDQNYWKLADIHKQNEFSEVKRVERKGIKGV